MPVIEFEDFLLENNGNIDLVLYLQHYSEVFNTDGGYQMKYNECICKEANNYYNLKNEKMLEQSKL